MILNNLTGKPLGYQFNGERFNLAPGENEVDRQRAFFALAQNPDPLKLVRVQRPRPAASLAKAAKKPTTPAGTVVWDAKAKTYVKTGDAKKSK